ncbi:hypothetical protein E2C01_066906 [Portunus trituberculatus]|uniref:Uncharacterized protein n=1 Tax=Portunus trituberculatus TaxID=210409 RepID=A0A5B7HW12_PORTR|nr:hypothetical protein [Portunus trituberculatus]
MIKNHYTAAHKITATRKHLEENTTIDREKDPHRLLSLESLYIAQEKTSYEPTNTRSTDIAYTEKRKPLRLPPTTQNQPITSLPPLHQTTQ